VQLIILGEVERDSYKRLVPEIERLFCQSLTGADIIRDSGNPPAPNGQESTGLEMKNSNRKEKVYLAIRRKRRGPSVYVTMG